METKKVKINLNTLVEILICNVTILFVTHDTIYSQLIKFRHLRNLGVNPVYRIDLKNMALF